MKYKISKKLFEQVTGYEGTIHEYNKECIINGDVEEHISINDFFFMCKEWALKQGYSLRSYPKYSELAKTTNYECEVYEHITSRYITEIYLKDSEQQAVFDACMYILDIKKEG